MIFAILSLPFACCSWLLLTKTRIYLQVFRARTSPEAIDLVSRLLEYTPSARITPLQVTPLSQPDKQLFGRVGGGGETVFLLPRVFIDSSCCLVSSNAIHE
jgi:hypothetical protein